MAFDVTALARGSHTKSVSGPMVNPAVATSAVSSVALGSLDQLSVRPSNPLTITSKNDPLIRGIVEPPFSEEQSEYVTDLLERNRIASSHIPFIHLLHIDLFHHLDYLMMNLKRVCADQGIEEDFITRFKLLEPYEKLHFAFFLLYGNHLDPEIIRAMGKKLFKIPYQGMEKEAGQLIKTLRARIDAISAKAKKGVRDFNSRLKSLEMGLSVLNTFAQSTQAIPRVQYDQLFFRKQREPLPPQNKKHIKAATLNLLSFSVQAMITDYLSLMNKIQPFESPISIHKTFPFQQWLNDNNLELIIGINSVLLLQDEFVKEQDFIYSELNDDSLDEIERALGCQGMPIEQLKESLCLSASCVDSIHSLNCSINELIIKYASLDDPSHPNYQKLEIALNDTAEFLGIERERPASKEEVQGIFDIIAQLDAQTEPSLPGPSISIQTPEATTAEPPALVTQRRPTAQAPVTPRAQIRPSYPRAAGPAAASADSSAAVREDRKEAPLVISPPRIRRGDKLRNILRRLKNKYKVVMKAQRGSHRQMESDATGPFTLAQHHMGSTVGPGTAKALRSMAEKKGPPK